MKAKKPSWKPNAVWSFQEGFFGWRAVSPKSGIDATLRYN